MRGQDRVDWRSVPKGVQALFVSLRPAMQQVSDRLWAVAVVLCLLGFFLAVTSIVL